MLVFTGDINLTDWDFNVGFGIGTRITRGGFNPFKNLKREKSDCWIGNFEGVASAYTIRPGNAGKIFRIDPSVLNGLHHPDVYGLANNHAMQHGAEAYQNTFNAIINAGVKCFGAKQQKTIILEHDGQLVSLTGMSLRIDEFSDNPLYWHNPEYVEIQKELNSIPEKCIKILYIHWGNEYINYPSSVQKKFAHWLIDIGFDLIIGMHPHILQGYEIYKNKYIFYSLGNFVFEMAWEPTKIGCIVKLDIKQKVLKPIIEYVHIGSDCSPSLIPESNVPVNCRFEYLNSLICKDTNSEQYHAEIRHNYRVYRKYNHKYIFGNIIKHPILGIGLIRDYINRRVI